MYVHGIRKPFRLPGYVVDKASMTCDLIPVNLRRDRRRRLACPHCGAARRARSRGVADGPGAGAKRVHPARPLVE